MIKGCMKMIFLTFVIMLLLVVFAVDTRQKRRKFLNRPK
jgi:hypothetical protein